MLFCATALLVIFKCKYFIGFVKWILNNIFCQMYPVVWDWKRGVYEVTKSGRKTDYFHLIKIFHYLCSGME